MLAIAASFALRVRVATVHVTVYKHLILQSVSLTNLYQFKQVVQARVYAAVRRQSHQVQLLVVLLSVCVRRLYLRVVHDRAVLAGTVNLYQVLIHDAPRTYVQVSHL